MKAKMDKKRRFDRANDIPNHDKYQKETFFSEAWNEHEMLNRIKEQK